MENENAIWKAHEIYSSPVKEIRKEKDVSKYIGRGFYIVDKAKDGCLYCRKLKVSRVLADVSKNGICIKEFQFENGITRNPDQMFDSMKYAIASKESQKIGAFLHFHEKEGCTYNHHVQWRKFFNFVVDSWNNGHHDFMMYKMRPANGQSKLFKYNYVDDIVSTTPDFVVPIVQNSSEYNEFLAKGARLIWNFCSANIDMLSEAVEKANGITLNWE